MIALRRSNPFVTLALIGAVVTASPGRTEELAAEVYRSDDLVIHAGISGLAGRIVHFGTVLPLVVTVHYDADAVSIVEPDDDFFTAAWPVSAGPVLLDRRVSRGPGTVRFTEELRVVFRFQILACPDEQWTCKGTREYGVPEFELQYRSNGNEAVAEDAESVLFRPWPATLTVSSALPLDEEDQLFAFQTYFPTGAYPEPASGTDRSARALAFTGFGMAVMLGGILMWPFRFRKKSPFATRSAARWQVLLDQLRDEDGGDESRFLDRLRRCLVWYCTDELNIDPFDWLHTAEYESDEQGDSAHEGLRSLFMDLLHSPAGQAAELRSRLVAMIASEGQH